MREGQDPVQNWVKFTNRLKRKSAIRLKKYRVPEPSIFPINFQIFFYFLSKIKFLINLYKETRNKIAYCNFFLKFTL